MDSAQIPVRELASGLASPTGDSEKFMANILVVDDEPDVLEALARALRLAGYTVSRAANSAEALELAKERAFDLVVLDYIMPSMTGIELLNAIRAIQPTIRSVIVSGKIDAAVSEETIGSELRDSIEADAYLHKPLDNTKLVETIKQLLEDGSMRDWKQIAERNLRAKKKGTEIKRAVRRMDEHKSGPKKP